MLTLYISHDSFNKHLRRKAYPSLAEKMARTVHAIVKNGEPGCPPL